MRRTAEWAVTAGILALVVALLWGGPYFRNRDGVVGVASLDNSPVGTSGQTEDAPEPYGTAATLHDLETMTGVLDQHALLGWRVDFHVKVGGVLDPTSFWIGKPDNRVLVIAMMPVTEGEAVWITGIIEARDQAVDIRADSVMPE